MSKPAVMGLERAPVTMPDPATLFAIPRGCIWSVMEVAREYDLWSLPMMPAPVVLDVGANVGVFALAAMERWPGAKVECFEPHPETCQILISNLAGTGAVVAPYALDHPVAEGAKGSLNEGVNRLCCSLVDRSSEGETLGGQAVEVDLLDSSMIPPCDVLKVDAEGKEVAILTGCQHLSTVQVLLVEVHRAEDFDVVSKIALDAGLSAIDKHGNTLRFRRKTSGDPNAPHFFDVGVSAAKPEGGKT